MKLFVGNLHWSMTESELRNFFENVGEVTSVKIVADPYTKKSRGFGFVEMKNKQQGELAVAKMNDVILMNRAVRVVPSVHENQNIQKRIHSNKKSVENNKTYQLGDVRSDERKKYTQGNF